MLRSSLVLLAWTGPFLALAFCVPPNVQKFYDTHKKAVCSKKLASGFQSSFQGKNHLAEYCGDIPGVIFGHSSAGSGKYWDMDVDCDGANRKAGKCANDPTGQGVTAFKDEVKKISGLSDLDANLHPYVVFGNSDAKPSFDPVSVGMQPLSVMAVVCNNALYYGIWGDTNGGTTTGEASISLADLCFPKEGLDGNNGHSQRDVLYIGFTGRNTAPTGANWRAHNALEFMDSIKAVGDALIVRL